MSQRIVCWFSHGAASAVATKLAIEENKKSKNPKELVVACIHLENEHPDGKRFADIHVFGMTAEEEHRVDQLIDGEPNLEIWAPLIDKGYSKSDCFNVINNAGIELPEMYKLGYHNNNCIGCLKAAGAGYWNKIRVDFPDVFKRRAEQERLLNVALIKMSFAKYKRLYGDWYKKMIDDGFEPKVDSRGSMRLPLRYLPPEAGSHKDLDIGSCGFFCEKPNDQYKLDL